MVSPRLLLIIPIPLPLPLILFLRGKPLMHNVYDAQNERQAPIVLHVYYFAAKYDNRAKWFFY